MLGPKRSKDHFSSKYPGKGPNFMCVFVSVSILYVLGSTEKT